MTINETLRAMIPVASIEHANQALAIGIWGEMNRIRKATPKDGVYWNAKQRLMKKYGKSFDALPGMDRETMRYQDRVSRYPGAIFMAQHHEFFDEGKMEAEAKDKELLRLARDVARQIRAVDEKVDVPKSLEKSMRQKFLANKFKGIDQYVKEMGAEQNNLLKNFRLLPKPEEKAAPVVAFYARELKHLRELANLESMKGRMSKGRLSGGDMNALHDFAVKNELVKDLAQARKMKHNDLLAHAFAFKMGQLDANRINVEEAAGVLGRRLKQMHETGYFPEDKLAEIWGREKYLDSEERRKNLDEMRERGRMRERGFRPGTVERRLKGKEKSAKEHVKAMGGAKKFK